MSDREKIFAIDRFASTLVAMAAGSVLTLVLYTAASPRGPVAMAQERPPTGFAPTLPGNPASPGNLASPGGPASPPVYRGSRIDRRGPIAAGARPSVVADDLSTAFRDVAQSMRPSVVAIRTKTIQTIRGRVLPPGFPPEFEQFFGGQTRPRRRESSGVGSGVILRSDGYIVTNNHVVEGADELNVELSGGEIVTGKIVGTDPQTDLAIVKIPRTDLVAVPFGDSDRIRVGDWVVAIGSPFGLDQTVTAGIISGKNRVQDIIADGKGFEDFLQTDAAINPGNSGGPLVNLRGELVGINTAILSRSGGSAGIGFAIPASMIRPIFESILETGEVQRGFLGARVLDVNPQRVERFNLDVHRGGFIDEVLTDRPAARAGLLPGDVIVKIENRDCLSGRQLRTHVASRRPGSVINVTVRRDGRNFVTQIRLDQMTAEAMSLFGQGEILGARVIPITPKTADQFGYPADQPGLLLVEVADDSLAAEYGLEVGDVLESAAEVPLQSAAVLNEIIQEAAARNRIVRIKLRRGNRMLMLPLEPPRR